MTDDISRQRRACDTKSVFCLYYAKCLWQDFWRQGTRNSVVLVLCGHYSTGDWFAI